MNAIVKRAVAIMLCLLLAMSMTACDFASVLEEVADTIEDVDETVEEVEEESANEQAGDQSGEEDHSENQVDRDESRGYFYKFDNLPEMDPSGVKGMVGKAYFTIDGNLAVTLNLSNGTSSEQEVVQMTATIYNENGEIIADQELDVTDFSKRCIVSANDRSELYFEIDESNIVLPQDDLDAVGSTLVIGSVPLE